MNIPLTVKETQKGLLEKKFSAVELIDAYLARINTFDKDLNSFITVSDHLAYKQAKKADRILGELGKDAFIKHPLLGVVVAHKDLFLTKGLRTTAASKVLANYVPVYSATVVERLFDAGCITIGKTNHDAWGHGSSGENSDFGPTKNPWNKKYVPGGSSSGSAAAVSSGMALIGTGTDTGSSVRLPACFTNTVGLKPTYGSVSRYGVIAFASSLDSVGHIGIGVDDVEKVYQVIQGEDGYDSTVKNTNFRTSKMRLKIGMPKEYFIEGISKEVEKAVLDAAEVFEKQNIELVEISLPHTKYGTSVYYILAFAETSSNLGRYDGVRYGHDRQKFGDEARRRIMLGTYVLSAGYYDAYYLKAMKVRSKIIEDFNEAFDKVDAIIAPVSPTPPFKLGEKSSDPLKMYLSDIYTVTANLAGIPGLAIPCGFTKNNLPLGFQLMGPRFSEPLLFKLGKTYETAVDWKPKVAIFK